MYSAGMYVTAEVSCSKSGPPGLNNNIESRGVRNITHLAEAPRAEGEYLYGKLQDTLSQACSYKWEMGRT